MQQLKNKLFEVIGGSISIEDFEKWLYSDSNVQDNVETDDLIFQVVSLNYRDNHIKHELRKICFKHYSYEEFLIELLKQSCLTFNERRDRQSADQLFDKICPYFSFDEDYSLIDQFYWLTDELNLVNDGYANEAQVIREINELVDGTLKAITDNTSEKCIELLISGISPTAGKRIITQQTVSFEPKSFKKWFEFWK